MKRIDTRTFTQKYFGWLAPIASFIGACLLLAGGFVLILLVAVLSLVIPFAVGYGLAALAGLANPLAWGAGFTAAYLLVRAFGSALRGGE